MKPLGTETSRSTIILGIFSHLRHKLKSIRFLGNTAEGPIQASLYALLGTLLAFAVSPSSSRTANVAHNPHGPPMLQTRDIHTACRWFVQLIKRVHQYLLIHTKHVNVIEATLSRIS